MTKKFTLGRHERLKSRKQIEQLFSEGNAFNLYPFRVYYFEKISFPVQSPSTVDTVRTLQFGAGASTKNFKRAVDRNRIKRLIRESWRLQKNRLQHLLPENKKQLAVFFIYTAKELPGYDFVYEKTGTAINKLVKIVNENRPLGS